MTITLDLMGGHYKEGAADAGEHVERVVLDSAAEYRADDGFAWGGEEVRPVSTGRDASLAPYKSDTPRPVLDSLGRPLHTRCGRDLRVPPPTDSLAVLCRRARASRRTTAQRSS